MGRVLMAVLVALIAVVVWQATREGEEDRVRRTLREGKEAIEKEDLAGVMGVISRSYRDPHGLDYRSLTGLFLRIFATYDAIRIHVEREEVALEGGRARARIWAWAEAQRGGEGVLACSSGSPCEVELELEKEGRDWKVVGAKGISEGQVEELLL